MEQNKFYQIKNITEHEYTLVGCNGSVITLPIQVVDKTASAFTIQDAKDGDVLAVDSKPFIYNGSKNEVTVGAYCGFNSEHKFSFAYNYVINQNITPATKEQRDTLMKAMADAGWEFDFKKKELKKIEKKSDEYSDTEKQEIFLRSQRPHFWRPSDEQMEALKGVQEGVFRLGILESLYNDLKKLKS